MIRISEAYIRSTDHTTMARRWTMLPNEWRNPVSLSFSFILAFPPAPSHGATSWRLRARLRPSPEF